jgi:hypothetical protein
LFNCGFSQTKYLSQGKKKYKLQSGVPRAEVCTIIYSLIPLSL